jgi:A nuclease family of the HNH/ENDO VII superfamily with conserved AHH
LSDLNRVSELIQTGVALQAPDRQRLSFRAVNRRGSPDYDPGLQRHHILPRQLLGKACFTPLLTALGKDRLCFEDFRRNGLLLPANDDAAVRIGLPLHRGPHREYNELVSERFGQIEARWSAARLRAPEVALAEAYNQLELLQRDLRRRLLDQQRRLKLNRRDPLGSGIDFSQIDAMAAQLWPVTEEGLT